MSLRPATAADGPFLRAVHASTLSAELAALRHDADAADVFARMQFDLQERGYRAAHPAAAFLVVLLDDRPSGRLYVDRTPAEIHVLEIALLPEHRGRGIGTELLRGLIDEARQSGRRVTLSVLRFNPALALYRRLGFSATGSDEVRTQLEWRAGDCP
ncbi:MAG: GNAT family N-acetyltransferase [Solirubrobacteraceae bacterium]